MLRLIKSIHKYKFLKPKILIIIRANLISLLTQTGGEHFCLSCSVVQEKNDNHVRATPILNSAKR